MTPAVRIEDYGMIGDTQTACLVSRTGSIDWLCLPRFDSAACFARLLGDDENGFWSLRPRGDFRVSRRYLHRTLVLKTTYETPTGRASVFDLMPIRGGEPDLVRLVRGEEGRVPIEMILSPRFDYGRTIPWVLEHNETVQWIGGPDALVLHSDVPVQLERDRALVTFEIAAGEEASFLLAWFPSHELPPEPIGTTDALSVTVDWWHEWCRRRDPESDLDESVVRSLITLKALTYAPTGGIVAAPTSSLPEELGGVRNWDYRFCWVRDATFTLYALLTAGYTQEAIEWRDWLLRAASGDPDQMQIMYGVAGERRLPELELPWLSGFEGSRPVRIGNAASDQFQLDVYGELMDAMHQARRAGIPPLERSWQLQRDLMEFLEGCWREPDEGIWEVRGPRRHFTHSKVMAWVAFDRAVKAVDRFQLEGPRERWVSLRDEVRAEILKRGFNAEVGAFTQYYGSDLLDASLLMIPLVGFLPAEDERVIRTMETIRADLTVDGFVRRYSSAATTGVDGLPGDEATFLPCSFWLADNLALMGKHEAARALFEKITGSANDLGLLSEEYDPIARRLLGNFPQAFSHVGLVNTARNLSLAGGPAHGRCES